MKADTVTSQIPPDTRTRNKSLLQEDGFGEALRIKSTYG